MRGLLIVFLFWPIVVLAEEKPFFEHHKEGWFWYDDPRKKDNAKTQPIPQTPIDPTQEMTVLQKKVTDSLNKAILHPTEENLRQYAKMYFEVINKGQDFTDAYKLMLLKNPEYDYSLQFPTNHNARLVYDRRQGQAAELAIKKLASTHGFFFFFAGQCEYCHIFAPTVKRFSEKYGIHVMPISLDGGTVADFPNAIRDNGISKALNVTSWPSLFAVNTKTRKIMPLTNGVVSVSDLEETILKYAEFEQRHGVKHE